MQMCLGEDFGNHNSVAKAKILMLKSASLTQSSLCNSRDIQCLMYKVLRRKVKKMAQSLPSGALAMPACCGPRCQPRIYPSPSAKQNEDLTHCLRRFIYRKFIVQEWGIGGWVVVLSGIPGRE